MGNSVGILRSSFYRSLRREYRNEGEDSFLYRFFWTEAATELLEKCRLPADFPIEPENSGKIRELLEETAAARWELLLRPEPEKKRGGKGQGKDKRESWDFWEELWLNDAGYRAGLRTDTDYYLWLVEYLAKHDLYYKDIRMWDGRQWLTLLLREGWLGAGEVRDPGIRKQKDGKSVRSTVQIGVDLRELAEQIKTNREGVASRLHGLKKEGEDYLLWLTARLERMALHIRIRNWLQNSGYPLSRSEDTAAKPSAKKPQKQDFSLRLFEAYCDSGRGGSFFRNEPSGKSVSGWRLTDDGFCLPDEDEAEALREALERNGETCVYIPLAVDLYSGCVLFLAGKDIYEQVYQEMEHRWEQYYGRKVKELSLAQDEYEKAERSYNDKKELETIRNKKKAACKAAKNGYNRAKQERQEYEKSPARLCFDFLRLDRGHLSRFGENPAGAFRLHPVFHRQAEEENYRAVLTKFIAYCSGECDRVPREAIPREAIREFDQELPAGIPETFHWAFETRSPESVYAFSRSRSRPLERPAGSPARPGS